MKRDGTWDETYVKTRIGHRFRPVDVAVVTAISDQLTLVADLQIETDALDGNRIIARSRTTVQLSAAEMRELADQLLQAANRVDALEAKQRQLIRELSEVTA